MYFKTLSFVDKSLLRPFVFAYLFVDIFKHSQSYVPTYFHIIIYRYIYCNLLWIYSCIYKTKKDCCKIFIHESFNQFRYDAYALSYLFNANSHVIWNLFPVIKVYQAVSLHFRKCFESINWSFLFNLHANKIIKIK